MKKLIIPLFLALLLASPGLFAGKIYKWVDSDGNVNYGSQPPSNNAREMNVRSAPASAADSAADSKPVDRNETRNKLLDSIAKEREEKAKTEEQAAKEQQLREENCSRARKNLASLNQGGRRFIMTESGERNYLDDAQIQERIQQAEKDIAEWCN